MSDTQKVNVTEIKMTHHLCSEALIVVVFLRQRSTVNQTLKDLLVEIKQNSHSCVYYAHDLFGLLFVFWVGCLVGRLVGWLVFRKVG